MIVPAPTTSKTMKIKVEQLKSMTTVIIKLLTFFLYIVCTLDVLKFWTLIAWQKGLDK